MSKQLTAQAPVDPIVLGKMGSSYGIRGWLRVFSSTEDAESIFDYQPWFIQKAGQWQQVQLESWKHHNQDMIIKLKGVDDRDASPSGTPLKRASLLMFSGCFSHASGLVMYGC